MNTQTNFSRQSQAARDKHTRHTSDDQGDLQNKIPSVDRMPRRRFQFNNVNISTLSQSKAFTTYFGDAIMQKSIWIRDVVSKTKNRIRWLLDTMAGEQRGGGG
jgi:hypothetical protein